MKKILNCLILLMILIPINVNALSGTYSISSNSNAEIGDTITVTFQISAKNLYYWESYITYDTSKLQLVSGSTTFQGDIDAASTKKTLKFRTKKTGTAWVKIAMGDPENNINEDGKEITFATKTKNITVSEKKVVTYSSNNYLKSLEVEGYKITPEFKKDTKEYSLEVPAKTTKIKINATKEDSKAKISGTGEKEVSEGINKFVVKVTAENGNTREYNLTITVKELEPINVTIDEKTYTVIRKAELLPTLTSSTYIKTTAKVNNEDVPALKSEITGYVLVGLKDDTGNINLYLYDEKNTTYNLYNDFTFNKLTIYPIDKDFNVPSDFEESTLKINEVEIKAYKNTKNPHYSIFKGINIETGEENTYIYDQKENTVQRYLELNDEQTEIQNGELYLYISILLGSILILTYVIILANLIKGNKKPTKINIKYKDSKK